jgi:hypothetical protein
MGTVNDISILIVVLIAVLLLVVVLIVAHQDMGSHLEQPSHGLSNSTSQRPPRLHK